MKIDRLVAFNRGLFIAAVLTVGASWLSAGGSSLAATAGDRPTLAAALAQLQAGHAADAADTLRVVTREESSNPDAWRALGMAELQLRRYDPAIAAFRRSLAIRPAAPRLFYNLGVAYAGKHDAAHAFMWLARARATRRFDMTEMSENPELMGLHDDSRFAKLLPTASDFDHPFVEPVSIIREWRGEASGDQFGWIARKIGDVDGDGIPDIVVSAPTHGVHGSNAGRIYVYSVGTGRLLWTADGEPGDQLGTGVEGVGDADGDGIPDVVAGGPAGPGAVKLYSGRDGRVLQVFKSNRADELFGNHVSGAGKVNGDRNADLIVGAPGKEGEATNPGHAYIYSGTDGTLLLTLTGERLGDGFGSTVAGYTNGREHYLVVGAPGAGPAHHGRVYVYNDDSGKAAYTIEADATGNALGAMFVSVVGDIDGDGVRDVYASDWTNAAKGPATGRVYVHSGRTGRRLLTLTGATKGEGFGTSPSSAGDVDGDGHDDLIVGAWQYSEVAESAGRAYLYSGKDGRLMRTFTCRTPGDTFGFDAVGLGDVDGDGTVDFLITSGWSAVSGHHSGRVFILSSGISAARPSGQHLQPFAR